MTNNDAYDELAFIKQIMEQTRTETLDKGVGFIMWGVLATLGLLITYFSVIYNFSYVQFWAWIILIGGGWLATIIHSIKNKTEKPKPFAQKIVDSVWISVGIVMTIVGFIGTTTGAVSGAFLSPFIALQLGIGFFVTGVIFNAKSIYYLSFGWWLGAIIMMIYPGFYSILLLAAMIFFLQVAPGINIYRKFKNNTVLANEKL